MSGLTEKAHRALSRFCNGKQTLSIPPQNTDDDMVIASLIRGYDALEEKLRVATEALEYYANSDNYSGGYYSEVSGGAEDKAQEALEKLKERG